ncbi:MAG: EFR1 family ferrodoxin [Clostridia bacterium]|nr:EFR1 family ferrodoxin [Clostridia bacterium]
MIYYFPGTGNSRYAAEKLAVTLGDRAVDIAEVLRSGMPEDASGEMTGFVFPVFYSGLPEMVKRFASMPEVRKSLGTYVYCIITVGADAAAADKMLAKALDRRVDYSNSVIMPDNYVILYDPCVKERAVKKVRRADKQLEEFAADIAKHKIRSSSGIKPALLTAVMYPFYNPFRITKKFFADESCTGCGLCERVCPDGAIEMRDGKPAWVKSKCQHCTACINRCPVKALQFGKKTASRGRYSIYNLK